MTTEHTKQDQYIALALFVILIGTFLVLPWLIPEETATTMLGLPGWYWLTFGIIAVLYIVYYAFTTKFDAFYELIGVSE